MPAKKPPSLLHAFVLLVIAVLAGYLGLKPSQLVDATNYQEIMLPPPDPQTGQQQWPEMIFGRQITAGYPARVLSIVDGDTIELLLADRSQVNVRLASIDAPERGQPFGSQATDALRPYVGQLVTMLQTDIDRYNRPVGFVIDPSGMNLNAAMVQAGYAWHYSRYSTDQALQQLHDQARSQRIGLWQDPSPIDPNQWRMLSKSERDPYR